MYIIHESGIIDLVQVLKDVGSIKFLVEDWSGSKVPPKDKNFKLVLCTSKPSKALNEDFIVLFETGTIADVYKLRDIILNDFTSGKHIFSIRDFKNKIAKEYENSLKSDVST